MHPPIIQLQQLPSIPLAVIRQRVNASELARVVPEYCGLVWNALRVQQAKPGRNVAIYWNEEILLEVGVELAEAFVEQDQLVRSATPAGLTASAAHFGPYSQLGDAHKAIQDWCKVHGHRLAGPNWEIYGHWQSDWNEHPSLIRTDVFYQVVSS